MGTEIANKPLCLLRWISRSQFRWTVPPQSRLSRQYTTTLPRRNEANSDSGTPAGPRWSYTPPKMIAPYRTRLKNIGEPWIPNNDPIKLDRFYNRFLGNGGEKFLADEAKWLAITHKSFDQGRRGFNDRLAFLGRRILTLHATLAVLKTSKSTRTSADLEQVHEVATDSPMDRLSNLTAIQLAEVLSKKRLARLATQLGMREVIRWKPKNPQNLAASGIDAVLTTTIYAIIGAIALQRGGDISAQVAREKILEPLGIS